MTMRDVFIWQQGPSDTRLIQEFKCHGAFRTISLTHKWGFCQRDQSSLGAVP